MNRRTWIGGASVAGLAAAGTALYRVSPWFWHRYVEEMKRPIEPAARRPRPETWPDQGLYGAWLGHSTVLLKIDGVTVITDPALGEKIGPSAGPLVIGLKRLRAPALAVRELPKVDVILLSHAHFDHFDLPTLRKLESKATTVITAPKTSDLLRIDRYGSVREVGWGERTRAGPLEVRGLEVNHWGARIRRDTWRGYGGYLLECGRYRVLFGGDTAWTTSFASLRGARSVDLALMPIGAYNPWIRAHCTPEQAWKMGEHARADRFVPIHHQTFDLSSEPVLEPIGRFREAAGREAGRIIAASAGDEFRV
ncbi:MAG: MBL fold metallo-hydrolase [Bryobacteraceae bacterium]